MTYVVGTTIRGRDNIATGSPTGRENMVTGGASGPLRPVEAPYLATAVSTTISRTGIIATATATAHGLAIGDIVRIAGADQGEYNGDKHVKTVADANTFTFDAFGSPTATATGTITSTRIFTS